MAVRWHLKSISEAISRRIGFDFRNSKLGRALCPLQDHLGLRIRVNLPGNGLYSDFQGHKRIYPQGIFQGIIKDSYPHPSSGL